MERLSEKKIIGKRFVFFTILIIMFLFAVNICIHAAEDNLVKSLTLPNAQAYQPYSAQIEMKNEEEHYTFELAKNSLIPAGLSVSEDGVISGTPTVSGTYYAIKIKITDSAGNVTTKKFTMRVKARDIKIKVLVPAPAPYDGQPHDAIVNCYDLDDNLIEDLHPKVTYGTERTEHAIEAGTHIINITTPSGCRIINNTTRTVTIEPLPNELSVQGYTVHYDGKPHGITAENVTVVPEEAGFAAEYKRQGTSVYTSTEPIAVGVYDVRVHTNNTNYITQYANSTITIEGDKIDFEVTNNVAEYDGSRHVPTIKPSKEGMEEGKDYTVSYVYEDGSVQEPIAAGTYKIRIELANTDASTIGRITSDTFEITPKEVEFSLENNSFEYDGGSHTATVKTSPEIASNLYTVKYVKEGSEEELDSVKEAGVYNVVIKFIENEEKNYKIIETEPLKVTVTAPKTVVNFIVADNYYKYDGQGHRATVTPSVEGIEFDVKYYLDNIEIQNPTNVNNYIIQIELKDTEKYKLGEINDAHLQIDFQQVNFNVTNTDYIYDGQGHRATVTPSIEGVGFDVKYVDAEGGEVDEPTNEGTYTINIELNDTANYQLGTVTHNKLVIHNENTKIVDFTVSNNQYVYDGQGHKATVTPSIEGVGFDVKYTNGEGVEVESPTEVGEYTISVVLDDNENYIAGVMSSDKLIIYDENTRIVNFEIQGDCTYNGEAHNPTITPDAEVTYTVTITDEEGNVVENPINAGKYNVAISNITGEEGYTYVIGNMDKDSFVIEKAAVNFTVKGNNYIYDGQGHKATVTPSIEGVGFDVKYVDAEGVEVESPTEVGEYTISVVLDDNGNYIAGAMSSDKLIIYDENTRIVNFEIQGDCTYNGEAHNPTITPSIEVTYTVTITDEEGNVVENPTNAGKYNVAISNITGEEGYTYVVGNIDKDSFVIEKAAVNFTVKGNNYIYDGQGHKATVTPSIEGVGFDVKYANGEGVEVESPTEVGEYTISVVLDDNKNYIAGAMSSDKLIIYDENTRIVNFEIQGDCTYNGEAHNPTITPSVEVTYTVTITDEEGNVVENPINAGKYNVAISDLRGEEGYTYVIGDIDKDSFVIEKAVVNFTVTNNIIDYDGTGHKATVTPDIAINKNAYTIQYSKDGALTSEVTQSGEYDIIITITDKNYILSEDFAGTIQVVGSIAMNLGNSPAAKLYKYKNSEDWTSQIMEDFRNNRKFTTIIPDGCRGDIVYHTFGSMDLDGSVYTVIVNNIADFKDPGASAKDGTPIIGSAPESVEGDNNLYKVTYTYEDESVDRYIMVIGRIGDVSGEGIVNAIDANYLDKLNRPAQTVNEARIWDVNKDGNLDRLDAEAIRRRFSEKLTPYYPWI